MWFKTYGFLHHIWNFTAKCSRNICINCSMLRIPKPFRPKTKYLFFVFRRKYFVFGRVPVCVVSEDYFQLFVLRCSSFRKFFCERLFFATVRKREHYLRKTDELLRKGKLLCKKRNRNSSSWRLMDSVRCWMMHISTEFNWDRLGSELLHGNVKTYWHCMTLLHNVLSIFAIYSRTRHEDAVLKVLQVISHCRWNLN